MALLSLNLKERPPVYPRKQLPPRPFRLNSTDLNRGVVPFRGLVYSFFVHQFALFGALFLPALDNYRTPPLPIGDQLFAIDLNHQAKLVYFPTLQGKDESDKKNKDDESKPAEPKEAPVKAKPLRTKGLSYPGPQPVVSDGPNATNKFQTLLQPALMNPPVIKNPIALPNILQMVDAGPLPKPTQEPTVAKKDLAVPAPTQVATQKQNVVLPTATPAPTLSVPERPVEPPTPLRKDLSVPAPTLSASQRPQVILPLGPATPALGVPEKPIELTALQKDLSIPVPSQAAPSQRANVALPNAPLGPSLSAPERPLEPPTIARKDLAIPAPGQVQSAQSQRPNVVLPGQATAPTVAAPTQIAVVDTVGSDRQNLLSISPLPAPSNVAIPAAEARGRFAISPEPNLAASGAPGVKTDELPKPAVGVGKKADNTGTAPSGTGGGSLNGTADKGTGSGTAGTKAGTGSSKDGGSANTPARNPFGGITVQGGRVEGTGMVSAAPPSKSTLTLGPSAPAGAPTAYGMTVVANAGTGGGLPDLGVFAHEQVYTVYLDMKTKAGTPAPSWTLQYALIPASSNEAGVLPPFPITKAPPAFPPELVQKYARRMVIVFGIIDAKGKLQQVVVKDTPHDDLNPFVLAALSKWTFRAAEANGKAAPVKVLMGIPLAQE